MLLSLLIPYARAPNKNPLKVITKPNFAFSQFQFDITIIILTITIITTIISIITVVIITTIITKIIAIIITITIIIAAIVNTSNTIIPFRDSENQFSRQNRQIPK